MTHTATDLKAVLWDFGGVITTSPFEAFNAYEAANGLPTNFIRGINARNPDTNAWAQFESSEIDAATFDERFAAEAEAAGHHVRGKEVLALLSGSVRPRMVKVLETCKAHFKVGCITNNVKSGSGPGMARSSEKAAAVRDVMALFDVVIESSVIGIRKPNPRIYEIACEALGVAPSECAFLDDLGINLKPAHALGMRTIKVLNEAQAIEELAGVTGLSFD
ncbi:MAG: HAD-IA family hydrolase [Pseudomonadota bacterium]